MAFSFTPDAFNVYNVGSFDAKTYFAEFLRQVQNGAKIMISKNGKKVAVLQGVHSVQNEAALEAHRRIVARSQKFAALRQQNGGDAMSAADIKELKDAGRKYQ